jgi:chromosome segregation ATPase
MSNNKLTQSDAELDDVDTLTKKVKELEDENEGLKDDKERLTLKIKDLEDTESDLKDKLKDVNYTLKEVSDRAEELMDNIIESTEDAKRDIEYDMVGISFN